MNAFEQIANGKTIFSRVNNSGTSEGVRKSWLHRHRGDPIALRASIRAEADAAHPGAAEQRKRYEDGDYQGWYPEPNDHRFGAMVRADSQSGRDWKNASRELAESPEYAHLVAEHGADAVADKIKNWLATPEQVGRKLKEEADWRAEKTLVDQFGSKGSLPHLAKMFPDHVVERSTYSEDGDSGWAGGGPDSWSGGTEHVPVTSIGRIAVDMVKAGERPGIAMQAAVAAETARLAAEGKKKAEAEAILRGDRESREALARSERKAYSDFNSIRKNLSDGRGLDPWTRRASGTRARWADEYRGAAKDIEAIDAPTAAVQEVKDRHIAELQELAEKHSRQSELAKQWEGIHARSMNGTATEEELQSLLDSGFLHAGEKQDIMAGIKAKADAKAKVIEKQKFGTSSWGALDSLKL